MFAKSNLEEIKKDPQKSMALFFAGLKQSGLITEDDREIGDISFKIPPQLAKEQLENPDFNPTDPKHIAKVMGITLNGTPDQILFTAELTIKGKTIALPITPGSLVLLKQKLK